MGAQYVNLEIQLDMMLDDGIETDKGCWEDVQIETGNSLKKVLAIFARYLSF